MGYKIGYCTNVHAGADLHQTRRNLREYAVAVKQKFCPDGPMQLGLWLSDASTRRLQDNSELNEFAAFLAEAELVPFTLNGFPYGDFHQPVVKHDVYHPNWFEESRAAYTERLFRIFASLLPADEEGSISTLPLAWRDPPADSSSLARAAGYMRRIASSLTEIEAETGHCMYLCIEPEPGCIIQYSQDVVWFFNEFLLRGGEEHRLRRHIRVCHDICHATVMREDQAGVLQRYKGQGIGVGKMQVSSAPRVRFATLSREERKRAMATLHRMTEDRYLHQSTLTSVNGDVQFFDDLPQALESIGDGEDFKGEIRIHYHIPVYLDGFGGVEATKPEIARCIGAALEFSDCRHLEVETYAWNVLPAELRQQNLATGIAEELLWFSAEFNKLQKSRSNNSDSAAGRESMTMETNHSEMLSRPPQKKKREMT